MSTRAEIRMTLEQEGDKSVVRAWLKQVGDSVLRDEAIVEIETDKVAIEVPSPADGVLAEIIKPPKRYQNSILSRGKSATN